MIARKKCKGTGKANYADGCGLLVPTNERKYGLCRDCFKDWMLNTNQGQEYLRKMVIPRAKKQVEREIKKRDRIKKAEMKEKLKSLTKLRNEAREPFQQWIRLRDANKACISCNSTTSDIWDGGHFYKAEIYSGLIFDEENCHKQCRKCNSYLGGNENNYRLGLLRRYGEEYVHRLDEKAIRLRQYKYTRDELIEIKKKYVEKLRHDLNPDHF